LHSCALLLRERERQRGRQGETGKGRKSVGRVALLRPAPEREREAESEKGRKSVGRVALLRPALFR